MPTSEELDLGLGDIDIQPIPEAKSKKKAEAPVRATAIDPEDDRENWPTIRIEPVEGKPNYETIVCGGTRKNGKPFLHELQILREHDVKVPPSVVNTLLEAVEAHHVPRRDPVTGKAMLMKQNRSAIPWRMVKGGKYF